MTNGVLHPPDPVSNVIAEPPNATIPMAGSVGNLIISVASAADTIMPWGMDPRTRDAQLRSFWPTEPWFASALFNTAAQYVAFGYSLHGPPRTVRMYQDVLNNLQSGQGWEAFMMPLLTDMWTQDNGAFAEVVRTDDSPNAPVITLNHLDSFRCIRTGKHETPVIYVDLHGRHHLLKWYQVIYMSEFPSPIEEARGIGVCALSRVLREAQIMRDVAVIKQERAGGRFTREIHLISGVQTRLIEDAIRQKQAAADSAGLLRYIEPLILGGIDPTARVSKETINLASIPEDYDPQKSTENYILLLSMAFGIDYQALAPLPGGGLGSGSQSKVLNMKSRAKGPALFMKRMERWFNFHGLLPRTVQLVFGEQDIAEQQEQTALRKERALEREIRIRSGEITTQIARQMAVDDGDLLPDYLAAMGEENATTDIIALSTEPVDTQPGAGVTKLEPGPLEPPAKAPPAPVNNNDERNRAPSQSQKRNPGGTTEGGAQA